MALLAVSGAAVWLSVSPSRQYNSADYCLIKIQIRNVLISYIQSFSVYVVGCPVALRLKYTQGQLHDKNKKFSMSITDFLPFSLLLRAVHGAGGYSYIFLICSSIYSLNMDRLLLNNYVNPSAKLQLYFMLFSVSFYVSDH